MSETAAAGFGVGGAWDDEVRGDGVGETGNLEEEVGGASAKASASALVPDSLAAEAAAWAVARFGGPVLRPGPQRGPDRGTGATREERLDRPGRAAPGEALFTETLGAEICAAVARGRSLMAVCAEPGRPHRTTVRNWARANPEFAEALGTAYRQARVSALMRDRQAAAERALRLDEAGPPRRGGKASGYTPALGEVICRRLEAGETLTAIVRDPDIPCYGTVFNWLKAHPAFQARYVAARAAQAERLMDEARDAADRAGLEDMRLWKFRFDVIRWQEARVAARKYRERLDAMEAARIEAQGRIGAPFAVAAPVGGVKVGVVFKPTHFEIGPDGRVLAAPPRDAAEARAWIESTGKPYEAGVSPEGRTRPPMDTPQQWAVRDAYLAGLETGGAGRRPR